MVDRASQDVQFGAGNTVQVQQSGAGYMSPDPNKFATSKTYGALPESDNSAMHVLEHLAGVGSKLTEQGTHQAMESAYLDGMAKAGTIKSESELDATPLMRQWQTAGYRDTMGRVAAADSQAQVAVDMKTLREKPPEEFAKYLATQRGALMESWAGMTTQTRQAMFAQQLLNERAAIRTHAVEHYKFGVETEQKAIKANVDTSFAALDASKSDAGAYAAQTDATFGAIYNNIAVNQKLPRGIRGKLLAEVTDYALQNDHQALYQQLHSKVVPQDDGTHSPMSTLMSWQDEVKLAGSFRSSTDRTAVFRLQDWADRTAAYKADWENPSTDLMPLETVRAHLDEGVQRGAIKTADQYQSLMHDYYSKSEKKVAQSTLAQAYATGDQQGMLHQGKTSQEGLDAYVNTMGRKMPLPQVVDSLFNIGAQTGQSNAYRKVGELLAPAFAQIGNNDKIDPANAVSIAKTLQRLDDAEKAGQDGAFHQFLGAFDPEVQAKVTYMRDALRRGDDPTTAIAGATARVLEESKLTPAMRAELAATKSKEIIKAVDEITPRGFFGTSWLMAKSVVSPAAGAELATRAYASWFENPERVNEVMAGTKMAVAQKMQEVATAHPHMPVDSVRSMAMADVQSRTVSTDWGPLVVPTGFTPQRFFKVGTDVGTERIGEALKEYIKPAEGNRMAFSLGVSGQLMYQELDKNGKQASPARILDPSVVGPMVEKQRQRIVDDHKLNYGEGVTREQNGVKVSYNGDNTASVDNGWVRRWRDDVVGHEGIRDTVYTDTQGNKTAGVGILVHAGDGKRPMSIKPDANGKVTQEQINESFVRESDRAANTATRVMGGTGLRGEQAFKLYASLAYQSGNGFAQLPAYHPLLKAVAAKDAAAAVAALKETPAYKMSQPQRQQYYLSTLQAAMKG